MKRLILLVIPIFILSFGLRDNQPKEFKTLYNDSFVETEISKPQINDDSLIVNDVLGLLLLSDFGKGKWIIRNQDKSVYKSFDFGQPESQTYYNKLDSVISDFDLFTYKPDYGLLTIPSNIGKNCYLIKTKNGNKKLIADSTNDFNFYTWAEFLLSDNYVSIKDYYLNTNELIKFHSLPSDTADFEKYKPTNDLSLTRAIEIDSNWIKIKREWIHNDTIAPKVGWTKWTDKGKLRIDFWFLM